MREYRYFAPKTFEELFHVVASQADAEVRFLSGGTDLVPRINTEREPSPMSRRLPWPSSIWRPGDAGIREEGDSIHIGAATPIVEIQRVL
jgi:CO/xanthine dehydrogenase FAD-binding subunit